VALALLGGCSTASYPSLARRDSELRNPPKPSASPRAPTDQTDAALKTRLDAMVAQAQAADARFADALPRVQGAVGAAAGHTVGDEAWSLANLALAELESTRGAVGIAQANLDQIYTDDSLAHALDDNAERPDRRLIASARASLDAITSAQDKVLATLRAKMPA
jgi:hypothetical protein